MKNFKEIIDSFLSKKENANPFLSENQDHTCINILINKSNFGNNGLLMAVFIVAICFISFMFMSNLGAHIVPVPSPFGTDAGTGKKPDFKNPSYQLAQGYDAGAPEGVGTGKTTPQTTPQTTLQNMPLNAPQNMLQNTLQNMPLNTPQNTPLNTRINLPDFDMKTHDGSLSLNGNEADVLFDGLDKVGVLEINTAARIRNAFEIKHIPKNARDPLAMKNPGDFKTNRLADNGREVEINHPSVRAIKTNRRADDAHEPLAMKNPSGGIQNAFDINQDASHAPVTHGDSALWAIYENEEIIKEKLLGGTNPTRDVLEFQMLGSLPVHPDVLEKTGAPCQPNGLGSCPDVPRKTALKPAYNTKKAIANIRDTSEAQRAVANIRDTSEAQRAIADIQGTSEAQRAVANIRDTSEAQRAVADIQGTSEAQKINTRQADEIKALVFAVAQCEKKHVNTVHNELKRTFGYYRYRYIDTRIYQQVVQTLNARVCVEPK